ncbi:hypothetical protein NLI96_g9111 [Meripilus lineatus]|uniref:Ribonuclease H1 N-terminal domain-containing protein n=1 Tax=Meripilus lineatus TaxID=2056292 RepID=A0AAD5YD87_9APHY|nr:hypothetical protein NLI96_g9111 [Physisporinus lineatus]
MSRKQAKPPRPSSSSDVVQQTPSSSSRRDMHHDRDVAQDDPSLARETTAPPSPTLTAASSTAFDLNSLYSALETASTSTRDSLGSFTPTGTTGSPATPPARVSSTSSQNPRAMPTHQPAHAPNTERARRYTVYSPQQWGPVDQWHRAGPLTQGVAGATCILIPATRDDTQDGEGARSQVSGVSNSCHQSFPTWDSAVNAWTQALDAGAVRATVNPEAYPVTSAHVPPAPTSAGTGRYVAVFRGRHVGIFDGWVHCASHVVGVPNSIYNRFETFDGALAAFLDATQEGNVAIL